MLRAPRKSRKPRKPSGIIGPDEIHEISKFNIRVFFHKKKTAFVHILYKSFKVGLTLKNVISYRTVYVHVDFDYLIMI